MPESSFMSVDLPAPFSPTSASTSPRRSSMCMSCSARTPGKLLPTPLACSSSGGSVMSPHSSHDALPEDRVAVHAGLAGAHDQVRGGGGVVERESVDEAHVAR